MKKYSLADADKINWGLSDAKAILIPVIAILVIIFLGLSWRLHSHWSASGRWEGGGASSSKGYCCTEYPHLPTHPARAPSSPREGREDHPPK